METWMWISLWIVQTILGAVLWRKYFFTDDYNDGDCESHELGFKSFVFGMFSIAIVPCFIVVYLYMYGYVSLGEFINFLAGVKNKTENDNI